MNQEILQQVTGLATETEETLSLSENVRRCLENYFTQLDGEEPKKLYHLVVRQVEVPLLKLMMKYTNNNQSRAAKLLGISRGTLRKKLAIHQIDNQ